MLVDYSTDAHSARGNGSRFRFEYNNNSDLSYVNATAAR